MEILSAVESVNDQQKALLARKLFAHFGPDLSGRTIALLGLAFKPDTDDMREAPSLVLARLLATAGARVVAHDPVAEENARQELGDLAAYAATWQEAVRDADAVLVVTEWQQYRTLDPLDVAEATACRLVFDGRNALDADTWRSAGFTVRGMGRPA
jgi:UDPglucose 6-dehydrogenase